MCAVQIRTNITPVSLTVRLSNFKELCKALYHACVIPLKPRVLQPPTLGLANQTKAKAKDDTSNLAHAGQTS
jgi:hypothetical protein